MRARPPSDDPRMSGAPKVALLSHSNFGSSDAPSALKMRAVLALLSAHAPELEVDGEMHGDCALEEAVRKSVLPDSTLQGSANLVVCPNLDSASIAYNLLKSAAGNNVAIGPILLGCAAPVYILTPAATVRRIVNMSALCVVEASRAAGRILGAAIAASRREVRALRDCAEHRLRARALRAPRRARRDPDS